MDGSEERGGIFRVACGNAAPTLKMEEGIFNEVTKFIEVSVVVALDFAIFLGRDDWINALLGGLLKDRIGVVSPISK